jgi:hypothetical protein
MRRTALGALLVSLALGAGHATGEVFQKEGLRVRASVDFAPRALPRERTAPITVRLGGQIGTATGAQPPALSKLSIAVNRASRISVAGLPTCTAARLQQTTTEAALSACRPARVGHGSFAADIDFPEDRVISASGNVLAFNARIGERPGMLLHFYISSPVKAALILPLRISHRPGELGTVLSTHIPTLAAGLGHVTELHLTLGRRYAFRGERRGFLNARCAAPEGFTGGPFQLAKLTLAFVGGRRVEGSIERACRVRRAGARR